MLYRLFYKGVVSHLPDKWVEKTGGLFFGVLSYFNLNRKPKLAFEMHGHQFPSVVGMPSGWVDSPDKIHTLKRFNAGIITVKTITAHPKDGNPHPRIVRGTNYLINSLGLPNKGLEWWVDHFQSQKYTIPLIVSIKADSIEEWKVMIKAIQQFVPFIELNFSCPNVGEGIMDLEASTRILSEVAQVAEKPLFLKLSPAYSPEQNLEFVTQVRDLIYGVTLINTVPVQNEKLGNPVKTGGKSGTPIYEILLSQLKVIRNTYPKFSDLPILATGGIDGVNCIEVFFEYKALPMTLTNFLIQTPFIYNKMEKHIEEELLIRRLKVEDVLA